MFCCNKSTSNRLFLLVRTHPDRKIPFSQFTNLSPTVHQPFTKLSATFHKFAHLSPRSCKSPNHPHRFRWELHRPFTASASLGPFRRGRRHGRGQPPEARAGQARASHPLFSPPASLGRLRARALDPVRSTRKVGSSTNGEVGSP